MLTGSQLGALPLYLPVSLINMDVGWGACRWVMGGRVLSDVTSHQEQPTPGQMRLHRVLKTFYSALLSATRSLFLFPQQNLSSGKKRVTGPLSCLPWLLGIYVNVGIEIEKMLDNSGSWAVWDNVVFRFFVSRLW